MANGNGNGGMVISIFKAIFGDVPLQWIRLVLLGGALAWAMFSLRDFRREIKSEGASVRGALTEYIASNKAWQEANVAQRQRLLSKVEVRFKRLYREHDLEYSEIEQ